VLWVGAEVGAQWGGGVVPCSISPAPINQMELGNESESARRTTWERNKHLVRKISIFSLEPIMCTKTHELSANLIKLE
jgi:hypothetical protein